ncbi:hypothetical protein [Azonexus sp.]|uniref:hypothetical protein n=1 Tax=Azonexus sp. TaxID=1872668 RepID=UPI0027B8A484|nr:hypothetical protein [Azonexus sp.]
MTPTQSKQIISSLANGVDPETGELLPAESVINDPQIVRALFVAVQALEKAEKRVERERSLPENAGGAWSAEEDADLLACFDQGVSAKQLAAKHRRTEGAIASRLVRLGRIADRAELKK